MLTINDVELDFDITAPADVLRYGQAVKAMVEGGKDIEQPNIAPDDPEHMAKYVAYLNAELKLFGDFLDGAFGDGTGDKLLGSNPSLTKVFDVYDALQEALPEQSKAFAARMQRYKPNRATRRSAKK